MFYCEACRINYEWPTSLGRSRGKCECCNIVGDCWDRPSSSLPPVLKKQAKIDQMDVGFTAAITGLPDTPTKENWPFDFNELLIDTFRTSPGGGFSLNRNDNAVRIKHLPSGLEATASAERSQHRNKVDAMRELANLVRQWKEAGSPIADPDDPFPEKTDAELGFAYRMLVKAHRGGLNVNFLTGDISLPKMKLS